MRELKSLGTVEREREREHNFSKIAEVYLTYAKTAFQKINKEYN